jgi:hypothetical protein
MSAATRQYITTALTAFPGSTIREILVRIATSGVHGISISRGQFNDELATMQALRLIEHDSGSPARWSLVQRQPNLQNIPIRTEEGTRIRRGFPEGI